MGPVLTSFALFHRKREREGERKKGKVRKGKGKKGKEKELAPQASTK